MRTTTLIIVMGGNKKWSLPRYLWKGPATQLSSFETVTDWTAQGACTRVANTTQFKEGAQSMRTSTVSTGGTGDNRRDVTLDISGVGRILLWVYNHNANIVSDLSGSPGLKFYTTADNLNGYNLNLDKAWLVNGASGWGLYSLPRASLTNIGTPSGWNIVRLQLRFVAVAGVVADLSFDDLRLVNEAIPATLIQFDDGSTEVYTKAFPAMRANGLRGTVYVITSKIGTAGYMTWPQIQELQAAGWTIGNHTQNHTDLTTLTEAQQETEISAGITDLAAQGITTGKYLAYPQGSWNTNTITAMTNLNMLVGRSVYGHINRPCTIPNFDLYHMETDSIYAAGGSNPVTLAQAQGYIDDTITKQTVMPFLFHKLDDAANFQWSQADFTSLVQYIKAKKSQRLIADLTIDDFYKLHQGPVSIPK
jgi:peptidoglycan/xylan/chitin deacetylase (PgdA/CDA1 family)